MNPSKLMFVLGSALICIGGAGIAFVWSAHGTWWSYYGPAAFILSGFGHLQAKHHRH